MKYLLFALVLFGSGFSRGDQTFSWSIRGYPNAGGGCPEAAAVLTETFAKVSQIGTFKVSCNVDTFGAGLNVSVRYVSATALDLVSNDPWPTSRSYQGCLSKLAPEEAFFKQTTELTPFLKYCAFYAEKNSWGGAVRTFTPVVWALGKPKALIRSLSMRMEAGQYYGEAATIKEIVDKSVQRGIPVVEALIDAPIQTKTYDSDLWLRLVIPPERAQHDFSFDYLLGNQLELFNLLLPWELDQDPMRAGSLKQCEAQRQDAQRLLLPDGIVWFCLWDPMQFESVLYNLRIKPGIEGFEQITPGSDGAPFLNDYSSHEECQKDKPAVLEYYTQKLRRRFVGALCSWESRLKPNVRVKMFAYTRHES